MLFLIDAEIDYGGMGGRKTDILRREHARTAELINDGVALCEWRKASGEGVFAVWNVADNEALTKMISELPIRPYFKRLIVHPLVAHPLWPDGHNTNGDVPR